MPNDDVWNTAGKENDGVTEHVEITEGNILEQIKSFKPFDKAIDFCGYDSKLTASIHGSMDGIVVSFPRYKLENTQMVTSGVQR